MLNIDFTFMFTAINLVVLYLFLNKFLFKKVGAYMEERSKNIESEMEKAKTMTAEGEAYRKEQQGIRDATAEERKEILSEAREKAVKEADAIILEAKKDSLGLLNSAHEEIERDHERALNELRGEIASLALAAASKVIEANMDNDKNRKLVEEFLDKEGVA